MTSSILRVENVTVHIPSGDKGIVHAVDDASFFIRENEMFAMIGESGSGKSILGSAVMRLLPPNAVYSGEIFLLDTDVLKASEKDMQKIRGKTVASIAQSPYLAMNPGLRVGFQIEEPMREHLSMTKELSAMKARSILKYFDIIPEEKRARQYPHQFSGGMLQRALVAMGTAADPQLIIADEPTTGVDVIQKRNIIGLFRQVAEKGCAFFLITHDIDFARALADRIAVNYCGQVLEIMDKKDFFSNPKHPYSKALLQALPENGLHPIEGTSPSMINVPSGCRFHPRCHEVCERCRTEEPPSVSLGDGIMVRCWKYA